MTDGSTCRDTLIEHGGGLRRDVVRTFMVRLSVLGASFASSIVIARLLGPSGQGELAALVAASTVVLGLAELGLGQTAVRYLGSEPQTEAQTIGAVVLVLIATSILGSLVVLWLIHGLRFQQPSGAAVAAAVALLPLWLLVRTCANVLLAKQRVPEYNRGDWLPAVLRALLVVPAVAYWPKYVMGALAAIAMALSIAAIHLLLCCRAVIADRPRIDGQHTLRFVRTGVIYAVALFLLNAHYRTDILLLARYAPAHEVGLYSVATALAEVAWVLPSAVGMMVFSRSPRLRTDIDRRAFAETVIRSAAKTLVASALLATMLAAVVWFGLGAIAGADYTPARTLVVALLPGIVLLSVNVILQMDVAGRGRPGLNCAVLLPAVALNIALNLLLVPSHGAVAAAINSSISYTFASILGLLMYVRLVGVSWHEVGHLVRPSMLIRDAASALRKMAGRRATAAQLPSPTVPDGESDEAVRAKPGS